MGKRTKLYVAHVKNSQSFFGAWSLISKKVRTYPVEGNQNTEQIILAMDRLQHETRNDKIAVVLDNSRFHHAKTLTSPLEPGQILDHITPIHLPPYAPEHNPTEHVRNATKGHIANIQRAPKKHSTPSVPTSPDAHSTTTSNTPQSKPKLAALFQYSHRSHSSP